MAEKPNDSNGKKCYFGRIPAWMREPDFIQGLTATEIKLLFTLCATVDKEWQIQASMTALAEVIGSSRRQAMRCVESLVAKGAIAAEKSAGEVTIYTVNKERIIPPQPGEKPDENVTSDEPKSDGNVTSQEMSPVTKTPETGDISDTPLVTFSPQTGDISDGNRGYLYENSNSKKESNSNRRASAPADDSILSQSADAINSLPGAPTPLKDPTGASVIDKPGYVEPDPADDPDSHVPPAVRELAREFMGKGSWKLISARQRGKVGQYIETSGAARVEQAFRELLRTDERALQAVGLRAADLCHEQTARPFTKPDQPAPRERKMKVV